MEIGDIPDDRKKPIIVQINSLKPEWRNKHNECRTECASKRKWKSI
jgi:hypothetical protein